MCFHFHFPCSKIIDRSPVDEVEVRGQVRGEEVVEKTRQVLFKEHLERPKVLQHLPTEEEDRGK